MAGTSEFPIGHRPIGHPGASGPDPGHRERFPGLRRGSRPEHFRDPTFQVAQVDRANVSVVVDDGALELDIAVPDLRDLVAQLLNPTRASALQLFDVLPDRTYGDGHGP